MIFKLWRGGQLRFLKLSIFVFTWCSLKTLIDPTFCSENLNKINCRRRIEFLSTCFFFVIQLEFYFLIQRSSFIYFLFFQKILFFPFFLKKYSFWGPLFPKKKSFLGSGLHLCACTYFDWNKFIKKLSHKKVETIYYRFSNSRRFHFNIAIKIDY